MKKILEGFGENVSTSDQNLINKINLDPEKYISMKIGDFGKTVGASNSAVSKFIRRIGFSDYKSFQVFMSRKFYSNQKSFISSDFENDNQIISLKNYNLYAINETIEKVDADEIERLVESIISSNKIWCIGAGHSFLAAQDFSDLLNLSNIVAFTSSDVYGNLPKLRMLNHEDMVIIFSELLAQNEYKKLIDLVKAQNVKVGVITSVNKFFVDPRIDFCVNFFAFPKKERPMTILNSKIQQIFLNMYITYKIKNRQKQN